MNSTEAIDTGAVDTIAHHRKEPEASEPPKKKTPKESKALQEPTPPKLREPAAAKDVITDPHAIFNVGFLADILFGDILKTLSHV